MKKAFAALLLGLIAATPALASDQWTNSVGVNISTDSVFGIQGEYNLERTTQSPIILQAFWKNYSQTFNGFGTTYKWSYSAFGVAGLYDLAKDLRLSDRKLHPFIGAGLYTVKASLSGTNLNLSSPVSGGLYWTGGVRYNVTPQLNVEGSYNNFGSLTAGVNLMF